MAVVAPAGLSSGPVVSKRPVRSWQDVLASRCMSASISFSQQYAPRRPASSVPTTGWTRVSLHTVAQSGGRVQAGSSDAASQRDGNGYDDRSSLSDGSMLEPWLREGPAAAVEIDVRLQYTEVLQQATQLLASYDITRDVVRVPRLRRRTRHRQLPAPSLTAQHRRQQEAARAARAVAPAFDASLSEPGAAVGRITVSEQHLVAAEVPQVVEDEQWRRHAQRNAAYLTFTQQLRSKLAQQRAPPQAYQQQLSYQIGITDDWLQVSHLLATFPAQLDPVATGLAYKHLAGMVTPASLLSLSPAERHHLQDFLARLAQHTAGLAASCGVGAAANVVYGLACLQQVDQGPLVEALLQACEPSLPSATPAQLASLTWGLATLGQRPATPWLETLCEAAYPLLDDCHANQIWGITWGLGKLQHLPPEPWMARSLARSQALVGDMSAEGLAALVWGVAALGYVPDKAWCRAVVGMALHKLRSFMPPALTQLLEGLSRMGYKPREEICLGLLGQARRHMHAASPAQLAVMLHSIAAYGTWRPYRQFLFDFVSHSRLRLGSWSAAEAANVLWAMATFKYLPDAEYVAALLRRLQEQMRFAGEAPVGQIMWALGVFKVRPSDEWLAAWYARCLAVMPELSAPSMAAVARALPALKLQPPPAFLSSLLQRASAQAECFSCAELADLLAGLAELRYLPPDAWREEMVEQVSQRLPAMCNEDYGLVLHALAGWGHQLPDSYLERYTQEAARKLYSMSGLGLGLLMAALATYRYIPSRDKWWASLYSECDTKWQTFDTRGLALLLLGLGGLVATAPQVDWQRRFIKALRLSLPQPRSAEDLDQMLAEAAGVAVADMPYQRPWVAALMRDLRQRWGLNRARPAEGAVAMAAGGGAARALWQQRQQGRQQGQERREVPGGGSRRRSWEDWHDEGVSDGGGEEEEEEQEEQEEEEQEEEEQEAGEADSDAVMDDDAWLQEEEGEGEDEGGWTGRVRQGRRL